MNFLLRALYVLLSFSFSYVAVQGQSLESSDEGSFFEIEENFDNSSFFDIAIEGDDENELEIESNYSINGSIRQDFTYGFADPGTIFFSRKREGVEKIKTEMFLQAQVKPTDHIKVKLSGLADYEWGSWKNDAYSLGDTQVNIELKDLFVDVIADSGLWLRAGKQIIARGEVDSIKATDIINPVDISIPGQLEFKDIRMQVPAVLVSAPIKNATVEFVLTADAGADKLGAPGSAFDLSLAQVTYDLPPGGSLIPEESDPEKSWEAVTRVNYKLNGGDFSALVGEVNWNKRSLRAVSGVCLDTCDNGINYIMNYDYDRVKIFGISGNLAKNDYLFKYEVALNDGRKFKTVDPMAAWSAHKESIFAVGVEYAGVSDIVLSAEINSSNILNYSRNIAASENSIGYLLQVRWSGFNELFSVYWAFNKLTGDDSSITTLFLEYDLTDNVQLDGRIILYEAKSDTDFLHMFRNQDVAKMSVKYSF